MTLEIEREKERVFGDCGGKCGEAPCVDWNRQRAERQKHCIHLRTDADGICRRCRANTKALPETEQG